MIRCEPRIMSNLAKGDLQTLAAHRVLFGGFAFSLPLGKHRCDSRILDPHDVESSKPSARADLIRSSALILFQSAQDNVLTRTREPRKTLQSQARVIHNRRQYSFAPTRRSLELLLESLDSGEK